MIATDQGDNDDAPKALWLIRAGVVTAAAMAAALVAASWALFLQDGSFTPLAIVGRQFRCARGRDADQADHS